MKKTEIYKKMLFCTIVTMLATNCGGGGGGGGGSTPSSTTVRRDYSYRETYTLKPKAVNKEFNEELVSNSGLSIKNHVETNEDTTRKVTIGIVDGDFLSEKSKIKNQYDIEILENSADFKPSGSKHAQKILDLLDPGNDIKIIAASIGKKDGMYPVVGVYKRIFDKLEATSTQIGEKIKIINQSWGTPPGQNSGLSVLENVKTLYKAKVVDDHVADGKEVGQTLFVWANGNFDENKKVTEEASRQALLPKSTTKLERGWITVVGVKPIQSSGNVYVLNSHYPKHLAYAGEARRWAISTSGEGPDLTYGSSYAAPRVVKAAALVARKYNWMTNNQIRQVLFTTTDTPELKTNLNKKLLPNQQGRYKGKPTDPNDKYGKGYGWGILNTNRALRGPGAFWQELIALDEDNHGRDGDKFKANIQGGLVTAFENDIHGDGGLSKMGPGRLLLKGADNTFTGDTSVKEGILDIYGNYASKVIVEDHAGEPTLVLHKKAVLKNDLVVNNRATLALVGTKNMAEVEKNFTADTGSKIEFEKEAKLKVGGTATLNNTNIQINSDKYVTLKGENAVVLTAQSISGGVSNVATNGNRVASAAISETSTGENLVVNIKRKEMTAQELGAGSIANTAANVEKVLANLDEKVENGSITAQELELGANIIELSTPASLEEKLSKMTGEIYASAQALTFEQSDIVNRNLSNHLGSLAAFKRTNYEWQAWVDGIASAGDLKEKGYAKAEAKIGGTQFGLDKKLDPTTQIGVSFDYSYADADFNKYAGRFKSKGTGVSLYAKKYLVDDFYILGKVGAKRYSTRVEREILDKDLKSKQGDIKHNDKMISSYVEIGKDIKGLVPFIGYTYDHLERGSFAEKNAEWGIEANSKDYNKNSIQLGIRKEYENNKNKISGHLVHSINIGDRSLDFEGKFIGNEVKQNFNGIKQAKNTTWIGVEVSRKITPQLEISGKYDLKYEKNRGNTSVVGLGLRYQF